MRYIVEKRNNKEFYYKLYKNGKKVLTTKSAYEKYYNNKKQLGGHNYDLLEAISKINNEENFYQKNRYLVVGQDKLEPIGIEPVLSLAVERLKEWCSRICKYQMLDQNKKIGMRLIKEFDGIDTFITSDKCKLYKNGKYHVEPGSRKGLIYKLILNPFGNGYIKDKIVYEYPGNLL